jgi:hypothetical protein
MKLKIWALTFGIFYVFSGYSKVSKDSITVAPFGKVHLYIPDSPPESVTIMISGMAAGNMGWLIFRNTLQHKKVW